MTCTSCVSHRLLQSEKCRVDANRLDDNGMNNDGIKGARSTTRVPTRSNRGGCSRECRECLEARIKVQPTALTGVASRVNAPSDFLTYRGE